VEFSELSPSFECADLVGLSGERSGDGSLRGPFAQAGVGAVLVGVEGWGCGVDVVGHASAGDADVELFRVRPFSEEEVGFVDGGTLSPVDGGGVINTHVAGGDVVDGDREVVSGVGVCEVQPIAAAGVDLPAVAVAHPFFAVGSVGEAAIVRAGHDCLAGVEHAVADADVLVGVEVSGVEESLGDGGVELIDDDVGGVP